MSSNILGTIIIGFVLIILNVVFLGIIFFIRRRMAVVSQWPSTIGTVLMSTIERRSSGEGGYTDYPVVQYSYQINRQAYQSYTALGHKLRFF